MPSVANIIQVTCLTVIIVYGTAMLNAPAKSTRTPIDYVNPVHYFDPETDGAQDSDILAEYAWVVQLFAWILFGYIISERNPLL